MRRFAWLIAGSGFFGAACGGSAAQPAQTPEVASKPAEPVLAGDAKPAEAKPAEAKPSAAAPAPLPTEGSETRIKGSRVQVWLPVGMERRTRMPAFVLREHHMVISFTEFTLDAGADAKFLDGAKDGAELKDSQPVTRGRLHGFVGHTAVEEPGTRQQIMGVAAGNAAVVVTVRYPDAAESLVAKVLDSVELNEADALDAVALSGISAGDKAGLEVSNRVSTPVLFTEPGVKPPLNGAPSLAILSVPYPKPHLTDDELGQMLGGALGRYQPDAAKAKEAELKIGACPAYTMVAPGQDQGKPIVVYGMIARCPDAALIGIGTLPVAAEKKMLPRFEKIIHSLSLDNTIFAQVAATQAAASPKLP